MKTSILISSIALSICLDWLVQAAFAMQLLPIIFIATTLALITIVEERKIVIPVSVVAIILDSISHSPFGVHILTIATILGVSVFLRKQSTKEDSLQRLLLAIPIVIIVYPAISWIVETVLLKVLRHNSPNFWDSIHLSAVLIELGLGIAITLILWHSIQKGNSNRYEKSLF